MNKNLQFFLNENIQIDLENFVLNLFVAIVLCFLIQLTYNKTSRSLSNAENFSRNFIVLGLTTTIVITIVKSSLALSLGLVGALSIVRFRTPIKEPEELAYLFMAIAIGLGLGANQTIPTIVVSPIILGVMAGFKLARRKSNTKNLFLSVNWKTRLSRERLDEFNALIAKHTRVSDLRRFDSHDNETEATYYIDLEDSDHLFSLESDLRQIFPGVAVTFIEHSQEPTF